MLRDLLVLAGIIIPAGLLYLTQRLTARATLESVELERVKTEAEQRKDKRDERTQAFQDMEGFLRRHNLDLLTELERIKDISAKRQTEQDTRISQMEQLHLEVLSRMDRQQERTTSLEKRIVESEQREDLMTRYIYQLRDLLRAHGVLAPQPPEGLHFDGAHSTGLLD